jgi:hypothetical protein
MRIKSLSALKRPEPFELTVGSLPQLIRMAHYAKAKAFTINRLVSEIHGESFEWYGYTLADSNDPELVVDIGLPENQQNLYDYTSLTPETITEYQESLGSNTLINGWVHSHGRLDYRHFSEIDTGNQLTVLDYVTAAVRKPVAKREVLIRDLAFLVKNAYSPADLAKGSVCLITDVPVSEARILETIYGSFCYAIVIGDEGWHAQEIHYLRRGILSGQTTVSRKEADIDLVDTGRLLQESEIRALGAEVEEKIKPVTSAPPEMIERL